MPQGLRDLVPEERIRVGQERRLEKPNPRPGRDLVATAVPAPRDAAGIGHAGAERRRLGPVAQICVEHGVVHCLRCNPLGRGVAHQAIEPSPQALVTDGVPELRPVPVQRGSPRGPPTQRKAALTLALWLASVFALSSILAGWSFATCMRIEVQRAGMSSGGRSSPSAIRRSEHRQCWRWWSATSEASLISRMASVKEGSRRVVDGVVSGTWLSPFWVEVKGRVEVNRALGAFRGWRGWTGVSGDGC